MEEFLAIFEPLESHGPGSQEDSLAALALLPHSPRSILDMGCGPGNSTLLLAQHAPGHIIALDSLEQSLRRLVERAASSELTERISPVSAGMEAAPFAPHSFDLIWCENSVYAIGFERALELWRPLLRTGGLLVVSDLVWTCEEPTPELAAFWKDGYPDMAHRMDREQRINELGFDLIGAQPLQHEAWANYYEPLTRRLDEVRDEMGGSEVVAELDHEIEILRRQAEGEFNYVFFVMKPKADS